ncbi:hypothetical protein Tco_0203067 [Tanacetum coccineum]
MTHPYPNRRFVPQAVLTRATYNRRSTRKKELLTVVALGTLLEINDILLNMKIMMVVLFPLEMVDSCIAYTYIATLIQILTECP